MDTWTLERAERAFSEVVRRALDDRPQLVTGAAGDDDAVVVLAMTEYERLRAPAGLVEFLRSSPLSEAVAAGELSLDAVVEARANDLPGAPDL